MARKNLRVVGEGEELATDALDDRGKAGIGICRVTGPSWKQRVARKEPLTSEKADAAGRMTGGVHGD